jgi:hypothetical protein
VGGIKDKVPTKKARNLNICEFTPFDEMTDRGLTHVVTDINTKNVLGFLLLIVHVRIVLLLGYLFLIFVIKIFWSCTTPGIPCSTQNQLGNKYPHIIQTK